MGSYVKNAENVPIDEAYGHIGECLRNFVDAHHRYHIVPAKKIINTQSILYLPGEVELEALRKHGHHQSAVTLVVRHCRNESGVVHGLDGEDGAQFHVQHEHHHAHQQALQAGQQSVGLLDGALLAVGAVGSAVDSALVVLCVIPSYILHVHMDQKTFSCFAG